MAGAIRKILATPIAGGPLSFGQPFGGDTGSTGSPTSVGVTIPAGVNNGQGLVAALAVGVGGATHGGPAGWTQVGTTATESGASMSMWVKVASGETAGGTWTWTTSTGAPMAVAGLTVLNSNPTSFVNNSNQAPMTTAATTITCPTTTVSVSCLVIRAACSINNSGAISFASGCTLRKQQTSGGTPVANVAIGTENALVGGATGGRVVSTSSGRNGAFTVGVQA